MASLTIESRSLFGRLDIFETVTAKEDSHV